MNRGWQTGIAHVVGTNSAGIVVHCPHCGGEHQHMRGVLGSRSVIAGCHTGWSRCREYAIPNLGGAPRKRAA